MKLYSRYLREVGIPAIGFSPMPNTPVLLHDHNEFLNEEIFLRGIDVFVDIIESVSNVDFVWWYGCYTNRKEKNYTNITQIVHFVHGQNITVILMNKMFSIQLFQ